MLPSPSSSALASTSTLSSASVCPSLDYSSAASLESDLPLSSLAASVVGRCSDVLGFTSEELLRLFTAVLPPPPILETSRYGEMVGYTRCLVEYCSYKVLREETKRLESLGKKEFRLLTFDMMLAWETPDIESEAIFQEAPCSSTCSHAHGDDDDEGSLFYSSAMRNAVEVDGKRSVSQEAFVKIAPGCPIIADPITVYNLYNALTSSSSNRLHFLIYDKYLKSLDKVLRSAKHISGPKIGLSDGEIILDFDGGGAASSVLLHIGTSTWPGRLTLTNYAIYFESFGYKLSHNKAIEYNLTKDLKQVVKRDSTGPWGAHLFDNAVMYRSSIVSEPAFFEFRQFIGNSRRDYWFANIKEVLHANTFIRKHDLRGFQKSETLSMASLAIFRYRALREAFHLSPSNFKTTLPFTLAENLPKGDKILDALHEKMEIHCTRRHYNEPNDNSLYEKLSVDLYPFSLYTLIGLGLTKLIPEDTPDERELGVSDVRIGTKSLIQRALERSVGFSGRIEAARATLDQVKVKDIQTNLFVLKEMLFPLIEMANRLKQLAEWEDPFKSYFYMFVFLFFAYRGWIWYILPCTFFCFAMFMLWNKHHGCGRSITTFEITLPPKRSAMEHLLTLPELLSTMEVNVQEGNIFLLKIRSILFAAFPQTSNKVAISLFVMAVAVALLPFRYILFIVVMEMYTRKMPLRKQSSKKLIRRLREWWHRIPAAPVRVRRAQELPRNR